MKSVIRLVALVSILAAPLPAMADPTKATLYKNPQCGCCEGYAAYLSDHGFVVEVKPTHNLFDQQARKYDGCSQRARFMPESLNISGGELRERRAQFPVQGADDHPRRTRYLC